MQKGQRKNEKRLHCTSKPCVQAAWHRWIMKKVLMVIFYESRWERDTIERNIWVAPDIDHWLGIKRLINCVWKRYQSWRCCRKMSMMESLSLYWHLLSIQRRILIISALWKKIPIFKRSLRSKSFFNPTLPTKENILGSSNSWTTNVHCIGPKIETLIVFTICEGETWL